MSEIFTKLYKAADQKKRKELSIMLDQIQRASYLEARSEFLSTVKDMFKQRMTKKAIEAEIDRMIAKPISEE